MKEAPLESLREARRRRGPPTGAPRDGVRELFATLAKALRAYRLYEENNPVYRRFVSSLREAFERLWEQSDGLTVEVEDSRLLVDGEEVYRNESRSDSLAFLFYRDGLRRVTLFPGLEEDELERFLDVLHRALYGGAHGEDLLTLLWEENLRFFYYTYVDVLAEGVALPVGGEGADAAQLGAVLSGELGSGEAARQGTKEAAGEVSGVWAGHEVLNPTLYSLTPREVQLLEREVRLEWERDLRGDVLAALFDRLEEPRRPDRQSDILGVLRTLLPSLLARGALDAAATILQELGVLEVREDVLDARRRDETEALMEEVSSPEVLQELVRALEEGSISPEPRQLGAFLVHLRPQALAPLLEASEKMEVRELQPVLREAAKGIAHRNRPFLIELLAHEDPIVVAGAAHLVGRLRIEEAGPSLRELLRHPTPEVRFAAVEAAAALRASAVAGALPDALTDPERDVRMAAARALAQLRYRPAAARFRKLIAGKDIRRADVTEKIAFFESYGELGDAQAVPLLDRLLHGRTLLGRREPVEIRACAALALGKVGTADAQEVLERALWEDDPVVRSAVNRALRPEPGKD